MDKKQAEFIRKEVERKKAEFCQSIEKIVPKLNKELEEKDTILISIKDLAKDMGSKFEIMLPKNFYLAAKLYLWDNDIYVEPNIKDHERALLMRNRTPDDKLFKKSDESEEQERLARDILTVMIFGKPPDNDYDWFKANGFPSSGIAM